MSYTSDWENLADALRRLVASGMSESEAKRDLCHAIADRKINIRGQLGPKNPMAIVAGGVRRTLERIPPQGAMLSADNIGVPSHLVPIDFDWERSRPSQPWPIGSKTYEHHSWSNRWSTRQIDLIELSIADVVQILCVSDAGGTSASQANATMESKPIRRPPRERALRALRDIYQNGIPDQATEPNVILCGRVAKKLKQDGLPDASNDTILRAAGRRK
jgi:hypothetical protein